MRILCALTLSASLCAIFAGLPAVAQPRVSHNTWSSGAAIPTPVAFATVAVVKNEIYLVGGYPGDNYSNAVGDTQVYNPATNAWTSVAALPTGTAQAAAAVVRGILSRPPQHARP
jgi:energy-converting hydrogenase Eha subunit A